MCLPLLVACGVLCVFPACLSRGMLWSAGLCVVLLWFGHSDSFLFEHICGPCCKTPILFTSLELTPKALPSVWHPSKCAVCVCTCVYVCFCANTVKPRVCWHKCENMQMILRGSLAGRFLLSVLPVGVVNQMTEGSILKGSPPPWGFCHRVTHKPRQRKREGNLLCSLFPTTISSMDLIILVSLLVTQLHWSSLSSVSATGFLWWDDITVLAWLNNNVLLFSPYLVCSLMPVSTTKLLSFKFALNF